MNIRTSTILSILICAMSMSSIAFGMDENDVPMGQGKFKKMQNKLGEKLKSRTTNNQSLVKPLPIPPSILLGIGVPLAATVCYLFYRGGKYAHAKIKRQKDLATIKVSANLTPDLMSATS